MASVLVWLAEGVGEQGYTVGVDTVFLYHYSTLLLSLFPLLHTITIHRSSTLFLYTVAVYRSSTPFVHTVTLHRYSTPLLYTVTPYRCSIPVLCTISLLHIALYRYSTLLLHTVTVTLSLFPSTITLYRYSVREHLTHLDRTPFFFLQVVRRQSGTLMQSRASFGGILGRGL